VKPDPTNAAIQVVEERPVTVGINYENKTVVENGLQVGETVATDGQSRLAPGVKVNIKSPIQPATNASTASAP